MNVQFTDNSKEVLEAMQQAAVRALEKCGLTADGYGVMPDMTFAQWRNQKRGEGYLQE